MLALLKIQDFAIVEQLELEIGPGMTVMTGETGAGKSILVDALSLVTGERAFAGVVRTPQERAQITAVFTVSALPQVRQWLQDADLVGDEEECILRRSISADGRSRAFINERPVSLQTLRELGSMLVDIHGQHAHQSLVKRSVQRQLLDEYGGHGPWLQQLGALHQRWNDIQREILQCTGGVADREARLELLRYQAGELRELDVGPEELEELHQEQRRLSHTAELLAACRQLLERLDGDTDTSVLTQLASGTRSLAEVQTYDHRLEEIYTLLDAAAIQIREGVSGLHHYIGTLEADPERLQWVEQRLSTIYGLARKHHLQPSQLPALLGRLEGEIALLENNETRLLKLHSQLAEIERDYRGIGQALHASRTRVATALAQEITANMGRLGMPKGNVLIKLETDTDHLSPWGWDQVEFQISTNPGYPPQPLSRIASGGELSRIALAIQVITAQGTGVPTLVFDEVDVGIGGGVAEVVGQQLRLLGEKRQVLCVTHLPQVASLARHHLQVCKRSEEHTTRTDLEALVGEKRVREIARMLGGIKITDQTLAHAREMLTNSQSANG
jgi:DNA repair protein RecN (Recombination protein N)